MQQSKVINILKKDLNFKDSSVEKLKKFVKLVLIENKNHNLIAKSTENSIWHRHILDSAQLVKLIDFKLEFGRLKTNGKFEVILADEISPDTCRLWDSITDKKLDKDRFRKDLGDLIPAYTEVAKRLGILHEQSNVSAVNVTKLSSVKRKNK